MTQQNLDQLTDLYQTLQSLRDHVVEDGNQLYQTWNPDQLRADFRPSAQNFAYYLTLRRYDLRDIQISLANYGLSSLGRLEGNVLVTLDNVIGHLSNLLDDQEDRKYPQINYDGQTRLDQNTQDQFGPRPDDRYSNIMVTMPIEAAENLGFVRQLVDKGMEIARINSAHDDPSVWKKMMANVEKAAEEAGKEVKFFFDIPGPKIRIASLYTRLQNPRVKAGDRFFLTAEESLQAFHNHDLVLQFEEGDLIADLKLGEEVSLDDGSVLCHVADHYPEGVSIEVDHTQKTNGQKIKATKGINFSDRDLNLPVLTDVDMENLAFIKDYPAILGFSFVQNIEDINAIHQAMDQVYGDKADQVPICIKLETRSGFNHIASILVEANRKNRASIMIARGDLAVEMGYLRLSEVQEELLWLAEASHTPAIWATQVLESLAKEGIPTRAEVTDATMAGRAEVVMLNKGKYMDQSTGLLNDILVTQAPHMLKKTALFRALHVADQAFDQ